MAVNEDVRAEMDFLVALRRDLHAHPELGFEEERTSQIVAEHLTETGMKVHRGLGGTGVVGTLTVGNGPRTIGLRADMDALAMPETADRPYKSTVPGKMHACGHDGHTTLLLGAARELARTRNFSGTVHFIFQPAEEGRGGAKRMVEDGLFEMFPCDAVYGLHNMPGLDTDEMAVVAGPQLASSDSWQVRFRGVGTHGAKPHLGKDPVTAGGHFLASLQTIVGRVVDPLQPAVVSACSVQAGDPNALNVIPDFIDIAGTARAYTPRVRDQLEEEIGRLANGVAAMFGIEAEYRFIRRIPPVVNNADATARALAAAQAVCGDKVRTDFPPSTAGDDFAFFSQDVPGAYVWLGNGPAVDGALHHNTAYDFNDGAIGTGVKFWTTLVEQELAA
ncbi:amidohydrolase [Nitratireductor aquimarinus]|uniref:M20 aminoacylase family protein n=1 Tax=Alphaproteobacteria TaxID=28211 RepID=UPI000DE07B27|nr:MULTISPECIES: M20 aminoacylase family protein [Alphaproteobacteria]MBY6021465.1 amidohydrolase [Nitratireductor sp. DP7N14-4]MBN7756944.1 amidohydrolase [Nitratireductor aquimarinus]MBY5999439.1 amidohydrolase [Tritonibacter mobilis]MDJ1462751.1 M20 family metallopeptidase [Nitratireductor sp. GZWM139]MDV2966465.1 M20 aminoacylase family protein [Nitratireductor aquimarinus]